MEELESHLKERISHYNRLATANYYAAYACIFIAAIASFGASISIAGEFFSKPILAIMTALPGGLLLLNSTFKFLTRSDWHRRKAYKLQELLHAMKFEKRQIRDVSQELTKVNVEMLKEWDERIGFAIRHDE